MLDPNWRPEGYRCLRCGQSVWTGQPFVFWALDSGEHIVLHPGCACHFGASLIKDGVLIAPVRLGRMQKQSATW